MSDTKEKILNAALTLFAKDGYEAVSVSQIADALGITKGALYKHYASKRDIFEHILARMQLADAENAKEHAMPEETVDKAADAYRKTSIAEIAAYSKAQFRYWTEEEFPANFRKLLTLEQYRSAEMAKLYQQYLASGPLCYMADVFAGLTGDGATAMQTALDFYGPFFLLYSVYDGAEDKAAVLFAVDRHIDGFAANLKSKLHSEDK